MSNDLKQETIFGHPKGLFVLFFTEMWERFSYYGMRAILTLYMVSSATAAGMHAGLGWPIAKALALYGWYTMLVYVMSIPGGILADKFIGQKKAVLIGGLVLVVGHGILAIDTLWTFYAGLLLIILGVGTLKPNISTLVGGLYPQGDPRRDQGFTLFYIGINIGAFLASVVVGAVGEIIGWHYGFGLAGFGMLLGQITFVWGSRKYLVGIGDPPTKEDRQAKDSSQGASSMGELLTRLIKSPVQLIVTVILAVASIYISITYATGFEKYAYSGLGVFLSLVFGFLMMIYKDIDSIEKDRFIVLILSFLIVIVFWGAFEQAGGLMNIYARDKIDRVVSLLSIDIFFIGSILILVIKGIMDKIKKKDTSKLFFIISGALTLVYILLRFYFNVFSNPYEIPASIFQSVNPMFIMIFGTIVGGFWIYWANSGKENSSILKMAVGTIIMGIGFLFMAEASRQIHEYGDKAALILLILAYFLHTIGELSASPVALSFITKVAPVKYVSIMMGVYFAATGLGNKVAGTIGEYTQAEPIVVSIADGANLNYMVENDTLISKAYDFEVVAKGRVENGEVIITQNGRNIISDFTVSEIHTNILKSYLTDDPDREEYTVIFRFGYDKDKVADVRDGKVNVDYAAFGGRIEVFEVQDNNEFRTFVMIFILTGAFGLLLLLFLRKLKKLAHGAEDVKI
ncbi:MAG: peptide MFS transporter [Bacteroidetes bacterium]|nr:peptide MFS transporter [Bacteroidota bacterium]